MAEPDDSAHCAVLLQKLATRLRERATRVVNGADWGEDDRRVISCAVSDALEEIAGELEELLREKV